MRSHRVPLPALTRRTTLVRRTATWASACCVGLVAAATSLPFAGSTAVIAAAEPMTLISQELALAADTPLTISFQVPTPIAPTDTIIVGAYRRIDGRTELADAIAGQYGRILDTVRIDPAVDPATIDPATVDPDAPAAATVVTAADGTVTITVPSESAAATPNALQFSAAGLYPVTVDVQNSEGALVAELLTFVDRLPVESAETGDEDEQLGVSIVASVTAPPLIPGEDTPLPAAVNEQIAELSHYPASVPLSISISPDVLGRLDPKTLGELQPVLAANALLSQPSIPLDPSAAAAAGQEELFTDLLQAGEDLTLQLVGVQPSRPVWLEDQPLTTEGAGLLRSRGVNLVVLSHETYEAAGLEGGFFGGYTLYSQLRNLQLPDAAVVPTTILDPQISRHLTDAAIAPEMAALYTAAELVAWRDWLNNEFPLTRNSIVLSMPGGGVLGPDRVARLVEMADATGAVAFTDVDTILGSTDSQLQDGVPAPITLAPQPTVDLTQRVDSIESIRARQRTVSGMLVNDNGRTDTWLRTIQTLESSSITDAQVSATVAALENQFDAIAAGIEGPESYTFTMNGQSTNLHAKIENKGAEALRVVVHLSASQEKIEFPDGDVLVEIPAGATQDVEIRVKAKANGSSTIILQVLAPDRTPITADTVIKAQVNALTGLAQVLTGGMALVLATWWVRNLRRNRRARRAEIALDHHPARPKPLAPTVLAATAAIPADPAVGGISTTNTATTSTATITAATVIAQLDTSNAPDDSTEDSSADGRGDSSGDATGETAAGSTTLSDS